MELLIRSGEWEEESRCWDEHCSDGIVPFFQTGENELVGGLKSLMRLNNHVSHSQVSWRRRELWVNLRIFESHDCL